MPSNIRKRKASSFGTPFQRRSSRKSFSPNPTTSTTTTNINQLPFDCFFLVFGRFPLRTLLPLRGVSHAWNRNITEICARKSRLTLAPYSGSGPYMENCKDLYFMDDLAGYVRDRTRNRHDYLEMRALKLVSKHSTPPLSIAQLFSNVTELRIHFDCNYRPKEVQILGQMLDAFSARLQLRAFAFWLRGKPQLFSSLFLSSLYELFGKSITSTRFAHLKQLDLCIIYSYYHLEERAIEFNFTDERILSQLERFSLDCYTGNGTAVSILNALGPRLTYLSVNCALFYVKSANFFDKVQFGSTLTHARLNNISVNSTEMMRTFCEHFRALQFVQLRAKDRRDCEFDGKLIEQLGQLPLLTELRLYGFNVHVFAAAESSSSSSPSLKTVKKLTLYKKELIDNFIDAYCDEQIELFDGELFCRSLAGQFPNVQDLVILCRVNTEKPQVEAQFVVQRMRDHLAHFTHLRSTLFDLAAPEWIAAYNK